MEIKYALNLIQMLVSNKGEHRHNDALSSIRKALSGGGQNSAEKAQPGGETNKATDTISRLGTLYLSAHETNRHVIAAVNHFAKWADKQKDKNAITTI